MLRRRASPVPYLIQSGLTTPTSTSPWRPVRPAARSRSRRARSTGCSRAPTVTCAEPPGRATPTATASVRNALAATYATAIKQDAFSATARRHATHACGRAPSHEHPARGVRQPARDLRAQPSDLASLLARARERSWASTSSSRTTSGRRSAPTRPRSPYEQCVEWICEALAPLGDEYVATVRRGCLEERWVDVYPNQGKMSGAFSAGAQGTHPFIVMSFDGTAGSLGTLAHELGHSMHSYLSWQTQPQISSRYSLFVAEVASNFHQAHASRASPRDDRRPRAPARRARRGDGELPPLLLRHADARALRAGRARARRARRGAHRRRPRASGWRISSTRRTARASRSTASGSGSPGRSSATCTSRSTSTSTQRASPGAHALARGVLDGEPGAAERYLDFLRAGGSAYPLDILRQAGVDLASTEAGRGDVRRPLVARRPARVARLTG